MRQEMNILTKSIHSFLLNSSQLSPSHATFAHSSFMPTQPVHNPASIYHATLPVAQVPTAVHSVINAQPTAFPTSRLASELTAHMLSTTRPYPPRSPSSYQITIGNSLITFDRDLLLAPPRRDYAKNPWLLATDWEHLVITIHPGQHVDIGVKFWKQLYRGSKHWARLRKQFSQWAVCIFPFLRYHTILCSAERCFNSMLPMLSHNSQLLKLSGVYILAAARSSPGLSFKECS